MWVTKFAQLKVKFALSVQKCNHYSRMCRSKTVHEVEALNNSSYEDGDFFIGVVNDVSDINDEISVQLLVEESDSSKWGFQHKTSSPVYPQSNGLAERTVQTVKNLLQKAKASGEDPYLSLLSYRNTPVSDAGSFAQLLMNRRLRTDLPTTS